MYYFYVLLSEKDTKYYYGSTKDLVKRFEAHETGRVTATKYRRSLRLIYDEAYQTLARARFREKQIKNSGAVRANIHKRI